jgi:Zn-finger nucleic acid-binding protein
MARCNRCDSYVSRNYVRVFGDNDDSIGSCPDCRSGWDDGSEQEKEHSERKLTFRMSEFEKAEAGTPKEDSSPAQEATSTAESRFGRVGKVVSGLF